MVLYEQLSVFFRSRSGSRYLYDAVGNRFFSLPDGYSSPRSPFRRPRCSPVKRMKFPFSEEQVEYFQRHCVSSMVLCLTEDCNLRCSYCCYSGTHPTRRSRSSRVMSEKTGRKAIDWLLGHSKSVKTVALVFYGGEPLLEPRLIESLVEYGKTRGKRLKTVIVSNGTLLSKDFCAWFSEQKDAFILITMNGPAGIHDRTRRNARGSPSHIGIIQGLRRLRSICPEAWKNRTNFICNVERWNELVEQMAWFENSSYIPCEASVTIRKVQEPGIPWFSPELVEVENRYIDYCVSPIEKQEWIRQMWDDEMAQIHFRSKKPLTENGIFPCWCLPLGNVAFVDACGGFRLCEKADGLVALGDVFNGADYEKIKRLLFEVRKTLFSKCRCCWAVRFCRLCLKDMIGVTGEVVSIESKCRQMRHRIIRDFQIYVSILERNTDALDRLKKPMFPRHFRRPWSSVAKKKQDGRFLFASNGYDSVLR